MKKVLCIDYFFPPLMTGWWIGTGVIKYLPELGWQPIVVSAAESVSYAKDYGLLKEIPDSIEVHRIGHHERQRYWQFARQRLGLAYDFPDVYASWYGPALREARKVLRNGNFDLIYSDSAPYTAHFVAMELKKEFHLPWVAEFGDLWAGNDFNNAYLNTLVLPLRRRLESKIYRGEQKIVMNADRLVTIHPYHKDWWSRHFASDQNKIEVVTDGYNESDFQDLKPTRLYGDKLTIVFLGSMYPQFQKPILDFLRTVQELNPAAEVVFIGRGSIYLNDVRTPNFTGILHLPKRKAFSFAMGADFLFVVMPPSAKWTPSKTYEYLRLGKPILALVPEDSDPAKIIRQAKAGFVLSHDVSKMKEQLKDIFDRWRTGNLTDFQPDRQYIAKYERRKLAGRIAEIFDEVVESRVGK